METRLSDYLAANKPAGFRSVPHYVRSGDYLTYFLTDEDCYAERLDDVLTVYLARGTDRLVGCKVKGVKHILRTAGNFGVNVDGGKRVKMGLFFFAGAAPDRIDKRMRVKWYDALKGLSDVEVDSSQFVTCGEAEG